MLLHEVQAKQNWFQSLSKALQSEGLQDAWPETAQPLSYGETRRWTWDNGTKHGHQISLTRSSDGRYERPIHYDR